MVVVAALTGTTVACIYAAQHFAITTDITQLIAAKDSAWFRNQLAYQAEFPTQAEFPSHKIMVVLDAPTLADLDHMAVLASYHDLPWALFTDSGHVLPPHFDGTPTTTALAIGPAEKRRIKPLVRHYRCLKGATP